MDASNANIKNAFDNKIHYLPDGTKVVSNDSNANNQYQNQDAEAKTMIGLVDLNLGGGAGQGLGQANGADLGDLGAALANMSCISIGAMEEKVD